MHQLVSGLTTVLQELADQGIADIANHVEAWLLSKTALRGHLSAEEQNKADFDFGQLFHWHHPRNVHVTHSEPVAVEPAVQTEVQAEVVPEPVANSQGETQHG